MKKDGYKYQLEQELNSKNWNVVLIGSNDYWWNDEHWKVEYKYDSDLSFYICFIVDPQFEGVRKKGQGIYQILATKKFQMTGKTMTKKSVHHHQFHEIRL